MHEDLSDMVEKARQGDSVARDEFARKCQKEAYLIALQGIGARLRAKLEIDDVVQSSLKRIAEQMDSFHYRGLKAWRAWVRSIVEHTIADADRRIDCAKRQPPEGLVPIHELASDRRGAGPTAPASPRRGPRTEVSQKEQFELLLGSLARLPEHARKAVQMRYLEGKDISEIAQELGRSHKAVESILARAKKTLESEQPGRRDGG